jgi:hypothetical protein
VVHGGFSMTTRRESILAAVATALAGHHWREHQDLSQQGGAAVQRREPGIGDRANQ